VKKTIRLYTANPNTETARESLYILQQLIIIYPLINWISRHRTSRN